jgi:hypothetical protein
MTNKQTTMDDIKLAFDFRKNINITNGSNFNYKVIAVPINEDEVAEIIKTAKKKQSYKGINARNFISIGDPKIPTKKVLDLLPFIHIKQGNLNAFNDINKSYFYPPSNKFPTLKDHAIPFEDAHVLWKYYMGELMKTDKYNNIVLIKINK